MYAFAQPLNRPLSTAAGSSAVVCQDSRRTYAELGARCRRYLGLPAAGYVLVPVNSRLQCAAFHGRPFR